MKILVLNGSPKRGGSDTLHITRAFLAGMQDAAAQEVRLIHVIDSHIEYCTGCLGCMRNGGTCVHDDDMRGILDAILDSDLLLFSFPLYSYSMPAPLKALIDRTLPLGSIAMRRVGERYEHVAQADFSLADHPRQGQQPPPTIPSSPCRRAPCSTRRRRRS